jgi:hypothetical protein
MPDRRNREQKPKPKPNIKLIIGIIAFCVVALVIIIVSLVLTGQFDKSPSDTVKDIVKDPVKDPVSDPVNDPVSGCPYASGDIVQCPTTTAVYKIENGLRRLFTPAGWQASGNPTMTDRTVSVCDKVLKCPEGAVIDFVPPPAPVDPCYRKTDRLLPNQMLKKCEYIKSLNGAYSFIMQMDGNAVIYRNGGLPTWSTGTTNGDGLAFHTFGNLIMYNSSGEAVWASNTGGNMSALIMQDDGNLVLYNTNGSPVWSRGV